MSKEKSPICEAGSNLLYKCALQGNLLKSKRQLLDAFQSDFQAAGRTKPVQETITQVNKRLDKAGSSYRVMLIADDGGQPGQVQNGKYLFDLILHLFQLPEMKKVDEVELWQVFQRADKND